METCFALFRFDVNRECEKINEVTTNDPPAKVNNTCLKIKTQVDASCNVYFIMHLIYTFTPPAIVITVGGGPYVQS